MFKLMIDYLAKPVAHEAFFKKYASKKFLKGICSHFEVVSIHALTGFTASILTRAWAKKNAACYGVDVSAS